MMRRLLCLFGLHSWSRDEDRLECFGMGLEWFEHFTCADCNRTMTQFRDKGNRQRRVWPDQNGHGYGPKIGGTETPAAQPVNANPNCRTCKGAGMIGQYDVYGYQWQRRCPACNEYTESEKRWTAEWAA